MLRTIFIAALSFSSPAWAQLSDIPIERSAPADQSVPAMTSIVEERTQDVVAVSSGTKDADDVFAASFLAAVPKSQIAAINMQLTEQFGALEGVERVTMAGVDRAEIVLRFDKALGTGGIAVERSAPHRVTELLLQDFVPLGDDADTIEADIAALPGSVSVLFAPLDPAEEAVLAIDPDRQFAIGSTFKLYVLSALARQVEAGEREWSDVVPLTRRSFPSGQMQDWPIGSPVTLHTLATLMISVSDNTATDMLMRLLGRDALEAEFTRIGHSDPARTLPFLTTFEMFALKGDDAALARYAESDASEKRRILDDLERRIAGDVDSIATPTFALPTMIEEVEWFASGQDLRFLARHLSQIDDPTARRIMQVNTALPVSVTEKWKYAGYKGGSEPGVLNLTWLLQDMDDEWHVLAMSWNDVDAPLDNDRLMQLGRRILADHTAN